MTDRGRVPDTAGRQALDPFAPRWVLFDLNGTLLDPRIMAKGLPDDVDGERLSVLALQDTVVQAMADTLAGVHRPFLDYMRSSLERRLALEGRDDPVDAALRLAAAMPPFPDSGEALDILRDEGFEVGVLTNSKRSIAERALRAAGLWERLSVLIGSDEIGAYKPALRFYEFAVNRLQVQPQDICLTAAHWWDVGGARRAGLRSAWVAREETVLMPSTPPPDVTGATLAAVARAIVEEASPRRSGRRD